MHRVPFLSREWFDELERLRLETGVETQVPPELEKLRMNIVIRNLDPGVGEIHYEQGTLKPGLLADPMLKLSVPFEVARSLIVEGDPKAAVRAFLTGRIRVQGDLTRLALMQSALMAPPTPEQLNFHERLRERTSFDAYGTAAQQISFPHRIERRWGHLDIEKIDDPPIVRVSGHGYVGPSLVRADLALLRELAQSSEEAWDYIFDTTSVRFASPLNVFWIRRFRRLPNMRHYVIVAPASPVRIGLRAAASLRIIPADAVVRDEDEFLSVSAT